jgi:hypothetical protein
MRGGAIVPHAPLLLEQLDVAETAEAARRLRSAVRGIDFGGVDLVVVLSPHGGASGVYGEANGSLDVFGVPGFNYVHDVHRDGAEELSALWGRPLMSDRLDHGALVPLMLGVGGELPVVAASLAEASGRDRVGWAGLVGDARDFASALARLATAHDVAFVASVNSGAGLSERAPLTRVPAALTVEKRFKAALSGDASELEHLAEPMWRQSGSCSPGPLIVFGRAFSGVHTRLRAYEAPVGVGYPVSLIDG